MRVIKLNAINSTNSYLRKLTMVEFVEDYTVVVANEQTHGRGQIGTVWRSQAVPRLSVKWPNDILSENKKVCGILIENVIKQNTLSASIIGVGLNVNQTFFDNLPRASSLKSVTGKVFDLDEVLEKILFNLNSWNLKDLKEIYETYLFRKNKPSTFKNSEGIVFSGFIKSVSVSGNLQVLLEDDIIKEYGLKDISLLY